MSNVSVIEAELFRASVGLGDSYHVPKTPPYVVLDWGDSFRQKEVDRARAYTEKLKNDAFFARNYGSIVRVPGRDLRPRDLYFFQLSNFRSQLNNAAWKLSTTAIPVMSEILGVDASEYPVTIIPTNYGTSGSSSINHNSIEITLRNERHHPSERYHLDREFAPFGLRTTIERIGHEHLHGLTDRSRSIYGLGDRTTEQRDWWLKEHILDRLGQKIFMQCDLATADMVRMQVSGIEVIRQLPAVDEFLSDTTWHGNMEALFAGVRERLDHQQIY